MQVGGLSLQRATGLGVLSREAGLYYPADSLKTSLCIRGRHLMYEYCKGHNVPHKKIGKLVVARADQLSYIEGLHTKARKMTWPLHTPSSLSNTLALPTKLISGEQVREYEPDLSESITAALWSPETGIVDSHSLMESLETNITDGGGEVAYQTRVVRVDPYKPDTSSGSSLNDSGWVVQTVTGEGESDALLARTLINSSGLAAHLILNSLLPKESRIPMYYGRGSYASYRGPGVKNVTHLVYPCPDTGRTVHGFQSLGTHLTLDMQGKLKFGPDLDWLQPPTSQNDSDIIDDADPDFWQHHLVPDETRLAQMIDAVKQYLPGVDTEGFQPDYCGVRPKLVGPQGGFRDFEFHTHYPHSFLGPHMDPGRVRRPMITLLGIESPGLTSSLAIAERVVEDILCRDNGQARK